MHAVYVVQQPAIVQDLHANCFMRNRINSYQQSSRALIANGIIISEGLNLYLKQKQSYLYVLHYTK